MGAQDSFEQAQEFQAATGTTSFPMIWDESFESWNYYGVRGQPYIILLDANGDVIDEWGGGIPEAQVLSLIG